MTLNRNGVAQGAIPKRLVTTKGDIIGTTANATPSRLAVGSDGDTIVADSSASTGLRYQVPVNVNPVLNSAFQIAQRGTTGTITSGIGFPSADRWNAWTLSAGGSVTLSQQLTNDTTNLSFIQYCGRFQRVAGNTNTGILALGQAMETVNSRPYAGKTVTVSYYARKGANYSSSGDGLSVQLWSATTTDTSFNGVQAVSTVVANSGVTLTSTWQRFTATGTIGTTTTQLAIAALYTPTGTAGANDYFEITGVQIEVGSVATPFKTYAGTIQGELAACQRYYYLHASGSAGTICNFLYFNATTVTAMISFPVTMRTAPTLSSTTGSQYYAIETGSNLDYINSLTLAKTTTTATQLYNASEAAGTVGLSGIGYTNNASANLAFSAEL